MRTRRLKAGLVLAWAVCAAAAGAGRSANAQEGVWRPGRQWVNLNEGWRFFQGDCAQPQRREFDASRWPSVNLPHTWNTDLLEHRGCYKGPAWYRRSLWIGPELARRRLFLRFEGALMTAEVYVNGQEVGRHAGGYGAFALEITPQVRVGQENVLAVRVNNADNPDVAPAAEALFTRYGGLYRPVWLLVTDLVCITPLDCASPGVYLRTGPVSRERAEVAALTKVSNGGEQAGSMVVRTTIIDAAGQPVAQAESRRQIEAAQTQEVAQNLVIEQPRLWSGRRDPYLYTARVALEQDGQGLDVVEQPLGLRTFAVDPNRGLLLNGELTRLCGVSRHQDWQDVGSALSDAQHQQDVELILELGATGVRLAHYQQAETMYRLCDQRGLIVWAEAPIVPPYSKGNAKYRENCRQQLTELIRQNANHPSILFWGLYNEVDMPLEDVQALQALVRQEDPTRLTTAATNLPFRPQDAVTDLAAWNRYDGWYYGRIGQVGPWADTMRREHPNLRFGVSEYGAEACVAQQQQNPGQPDPLGHFFPEQYQALFHEKSWAELERRPFLWCAFVWNLGDFSWSAADRGDQPFMNHKGLVSWDRKVKKDAFYFYQANWSGEPVLYITSRRDVRRTEPQTDVKAYSNCEQVWLRINGADQGPATSENRVYVWPGAALQEGKNLIEVRGLREGQWYEDRCEWVLTRPAP